MRGSAEERFAGGILQYSTMYNVHTYYIEDLEVLCVFEAMESDDVPAAGGRYIDRVLVKLSRSAQ